MANSREHADPAPSGLQNLGIGALNVGNLLDTVEFVKNAWSAFGVPSSLAPTVDVDELDRRITDLKAVEQWLTMNLNLLKASVQALEIQRGTIATLKAYGAMLGSPSTLPGATALGHAIAAAASGAMSAATGSAAMPGAFSTAADSAPIPDAASIPGAASIPAIATPEEAAHAPRTPAAEMAADASGEAPPQAGPMLPGLDAGAWWNLLHRQFNQIAASALGATIRDEGGDASGARTERGAAGGGAPVARSRKTPSGPKTRKPSSAGGPEPGRRGRRPDR